MGFDHVALCTGAGRPTVIPMKNGLARGVRQASDFLMALQLTGAAKADSLANLQFRMPIVVIGGGLTAIDTATESLAYYAVQVEKFLRRYEELASEHGERPSSAHVDREERRDRRTSSSRMPAPFAPSVRPRRAEGRAPRLIDLLNSWGGVTIAYRRRLIDSPSYTLNHEEVEQGAGGGHPLRRVPAPEEVEIDAIRRGDGAATAAAALRRRGDSKLVEPASRVRPAGAHDPGRRRHAAQYRAGARGRAQRQARRHAISRRSTKTAIR